MVIAENRFYRRENFLLFIAAQIVILISVAHIRVETGSWTHPLALIGVALFSFLIVRVHRENSWHAHLYLAAQCLLVCLLIGMVNYLFSYLVMLLVGQVMMKFNLSVSLRWMGVFALIALGDAFVMNPDVPLGSPLVRTVMHLSGFILVGVMSNRLAQARRDRREIQSLLTQVAEAHARQQEYVRQSEALAVAEERNRLARELQHTLGHRLTVSIVQVEGAARLMEREPHRVPCMLHNVRSQLSDGLDELRDTFTEMRGTTLDESSLQDPML